MILHVTWFTCRGCVPVPLLLAVHHPEPQLHISMEPCLPSLRAIRMHSPVHTRSISSISGADGRMRHSIHYCSHGIGIQLKTSLTLESIDLEKQHIHWGQVEASVKSN